ncbi:hypothetical protein [Pelosinus sp. sgz500959]
MKWVDLVLDHSTITIICLVLCLLFLNFGTIVWVVIMGILLFALSKMI